MRLSTFFANAILLFTIPALTAYPLSNVSDLPSLPQYISQVETFPETKSELFSYDDVLDLLEEIEEGDIEERCSPEEIEGINRFMALLAKQGVLPGNLREEFLLDRDIDDLLSQKPWEFTYSLNDYSIETTVFHYGQAEVLHCRSWIKKQWDQTRKFVKKHKREIIIGAAIVVAIAVTVAVVVVVASSTTAGIVAGTTAGVASAAFSEELTAIPVQEIPVLKEMIDFHVETLKMETSLMHSGTALNVDSPSFLEDAREFGAAVAHAALDGSAEIVSVFPQLLEEIRDVGERFIPKNLGDLQSNELINPIGNFEHMVEKGHEAIDNLFGVAQYQNGPPVPIARPDYTYGIVPTPGSFGIGVATEGRLVATQANSTCGWRIGQPIHNRTFWGGVPKWSTVRARYWKNEAHLNKANYRPTDLERMQKGLAPQRLTRTGKIETMELHHAPPQREGGLFDFIKVWPEEHSNLDPHRFLGE